MSKTPYKLLRVKGYEKNYILNNRMQRVFIYEIEGVDCIFFDYIYNYSMLSRDIREGTTIEFFSFSREGDDILEYFSENTENPIVKQRIKFLAKNGVRKVRKYLTITEDLSASLKKEKTEPDFEYHQQVLQALNLRGELLETEDLVYLMYEICSITGNMIITEDLSARERVIQNQIRHAPDFMKIGDIFVKVISLKFFADYNKPYSLAQILDEFNACEYLFSANFECFPDQEARDEKIKKRGKHLMSLATSRGSDVDLKTASGSFEADEFENDQSQDRTHIGNMSSKVILWSKDFKELQKAANYLMMDIKSRGYGFFEEFAYHDIEFFNSIPSQMSYSERGAIKTLNYFADYLPASYVPYGDTNAEFPLILNNQYGGVYFFDPFFNRNNANCQVFGGSGSGKSMSMNLIISQLCVPYVNKHGGKILIMDNKGAESSYIKMCELFGGDFYAFDSKGSYRINPFPSKKELLLKDGSFDKSSFNFINIVLGIAANIEEKSDESRLKKLLITRTLKTLYENTKKEKPTFRDFLESLINIEIKEASLIEVKEKLILVIQGFIEDPVNEIITGDSNVSYSDNPFVVFDVQGLKDLQTDIKAIVTFVLVWEFRKVAFSLSSQFVKFLIFDEVAQLLVYDSFQKLIEEMFRTARSANASCWVVTQNYVDYKKSGISDVLNINTTNKFFLSHADDETARNLIAKDFAFTEKQKEAFLGLHTVKGEGGYSRLLLVTEKAGRIYSSVCDVKLSRADYWIGTSDPKDKTKILKIQRDKRCSMLRAIEKILKEEK